MKAQPRLGLARSWPWITSAYLIDIAVLILASQSPRAPQTVAWWVGVAVMAVVTIAAVPTYRGITVASALARWVWDVSAGMWHSFVFGTPRIMRPQAHPHSQADNRVP